MCLVVRHDNYGGQFDGGVTVIRPGHGSVQSGHSGHHRQSRHHQQQQQQYQPQQQQYQQQQQQYTNGGHGYVVSADGYVHNSVQQPVQHVPSVQYNNGGAGVHFNPGGRMVAGGLNSGYHGSMDSINSANSNMSNTLSYDSDLSAGNTLPHIVSS